MPLIFKIEKVFQSALINSNTSVFYSNFNAYFLFTFYYTLYYFDFTFLLKLHCIGKQIEDYLLKSLLVKKICSLLTFILGESFQLLPKFSLIYINQFEYLQKLIFIGKFMFKPSAASQSFNSREQIFINSH